MTNYPASGMMVYMAGDGGTEAPVMEAPTQVQTHGGSTVEVLKEASQPVAEAPAPDAAPKVDVAQLRADESADMAAQRLREAKLDPQQVRNSRAGQERDDADNRVAAVKDHDAGGPFKSFLRLFNRSS